MIFLTGRSFGDSTEFEGKILTHDTGISVFDSTVSQSPFFVQEFKYYAPQSVTVYFLWKTDNFSLEESVLWNENTTYKDKYLCNPMIAADDTFRVTLKIPQNSTLEYYFWITKNKQGHYQDFWDTQSGGFITVNEDTPIFKTANYTKVEEETKPGITEKGWFILLLSVFVYVVLKLTLRTWFQKIPKAQYIEKVLFLGFSLAIFHSIARSEIIHVSIASILSNLRLAPKIIRGSFDDFLFTGTLTLVFIFILSLVKNNKVKKGIYVVFLGLAALTTLIAFINITTVIYFGKPFTYQWLYYSDFLGSNEAKTAFQSNINSGISFNLAAIVLSMFFVSGILRILYRILTSTRKLSYIVHPLIVFVIIAGITLAAGTKTTWNKGQSDNAVIVMGISVLTANNTHSFFTAELPDETIPFDPRSATPLENPFGNQTDHQIKNILFVVLESAGAAYFDDYGGTFHLSPNLSKYASQALIFNQMYAHAPATNRSLVSMLGSMYPHISYKSLTQEAPALKHPTISSELKKKDYRTSFFSTADLNFQNCKEYLSYREFDTIEDFATIQCAKEFHLDNPDYLQGNGKDDMCLADRFSDWIEEEPSQNFFSVIWTVQGHYPYFFGKEEEDFGVSDVNFNRYLNCLKYNDELVGVVMETLENKGLDKETLVVVFGDHGEAFGQHQQYGHGTAVYEENIKVPLYFINSTLFNGERKNDIASMKDLASTAFAIIGAEIPATWQGRNLLNSDSNETFFFAPWSDYLFAYRNENMKYIFNETRNTLEVYDLNTDPFEKNNLAQSVSGEEITFARNRIAAWVQYHDKYIRELRETEK